MSALGDLTCRPSEPFILRGAAVGGPAEPKPPTAFSEAELALANARELSLRVMALVDRVVGPAPLPKGEAPKDRASPISVFDRLRDDSLVTAQYLRDAHSALYRLDEALP